MDGTGELAQHEHPFKAEIKTVEPTPQTEQTTQKEISTEDGVKFAGFYKSLLSEAVGVGQVDTSILDSADETTRALADSITLTVKEHGQKEQHLAEIKGFKAIDFLSQVFPDKTAFEGANIDLQQLSPGIFAVFLDNEIFSKIYPKSSQAVAIKAPDGIPFVMIRRYDNKDRDLKNLNENIPHETNHILWSFLQKDGIVSSNEPDPEMNNAFLMYQNELAAKLVSNGSLFSYTHLEIIPAKMREEIEKTNPETVKTITNRAGELNDILREISGRSKASGTSVDGLLLPLIRSKNFAELQVVLEKLRDSMPEAPPPPKSDPWETA